MKGFEENEISEKASGGTELIKRKLAGMIDESLLENFQIICSRERELEDDKIRVFWCHDLPEDPESAKFKDPEWRAKYHKFVFISNWQFQRYQLIHGFPHDTKSIILEHGIDAAPETCLEKPTDKIRLVYTSTPQRGLELLVPVFEFLAQSEENIHLDVFSSFKIYGWDDADKQFEPLYDRIRNHPQMTYHGFAPNDELKSFLNTAHIFAYPCIWTETACRAMIEAMSAGLICVHPNYGALPETSGCLNVMYHPNMTDNNVHANVFAGNLKAAIDLVKNNRQEQMIRFNKTYVDFRYNMEYVKNKWEHMLRNLVKEYPDTDSRKFPEQMFVYKPN